MDPLSAIASIVAILQLSVKILGYLNDVKDASNGLLQDKWDPNAELYIATTCLTYLLFDAFKSGRSSTDEDLEQRLSEHKFLDYAARHWGEHTRAVETQVSELAYALLVDSGSLSCATQIEIAMTYRGKTVSRPFPGGTGLHCVAQLGLCQMAQQLLSSLCTKTRNMLDAVDNLGQTALLLAVKHGQNDMAKLLLNKGASVKAARGWHGDVLLVAAGECHLDVIELLVNKGADLNAHEEPYGNALMVAAARGDKEMVELLVNMGADVNLYCRRPGTALLVASTKDVMELLIHNGADVNACTGDGETVLHKAISRGDMDSVELLLSKGADVNPISPYYGNALLKASREGQRKWL
ncbi:Nn.00g084790.m01.CDS01 [Neocucurbitaria sp. VM-36]